MDEAQAAIEAGYSSRMMLELAPERSFGVLSPAFKECEGLIAQNKYKLNKCTFLVNNLCELYGSGFQPLECRFCHHSRKGLGVVCHADIEKDWVQPVARQLVREWCKETGLWDFLDVYRLQALKK